MIWLILILGAYLLGSVSFSLVIVRALAGFDIRTAGSGNAGATNVLRTVGAAPAVAVLLLDAAKGMLPVALARALEAPGPVIGGAALAAVVGHVFPVYYGFRGGKGVATAAGAMAILAPRPALAAAGVLFLAVAATRYVALGSILAIGAFPVLILAGGRLGWSAPAAPWLLASAAVLAILIVFMHRDNIRRLMTGTENRIGAPKGRKVAD